MSTLVTPLKADTGVNGVALTVLIVLFLLVTVLGFMATRFKRGERMDTLDEWGLGGRRFGTWITWFLLGGDLYTAYTFIAVPALMYAAGAAGFFAMPYTVLTYPLVFIPLAATVALGLLFYVLGRSTRAQLAPKPAEPPSDATGVAIA